MFKEKMWGQGLNLGLHPDPSPACWQLTPPFMRNLRLVIFSIKTRNNKKKLIREIFDVECFMEWYSSRIMYRTSGVSKTSSILITHGWNKNKINHLNFTVSEGQKRCLHNKLKVEFKGFKLKGSNEKIIITWWSFFSISTSSLIAACLGYNK